MPATIENSGSDVLLMAMRKSAIERVWSKVTIGGPDECWPWHGATNGHSSGSGHGQLRVNRRKAYAHRLIWEERNGPIPHGLIVRHRCDNPCCCNPEHLQLGTQADNMADMKDRGRACKAARFWGSAHPRARFTEWDVHCIRFAVALGATQMALVKSYGVSRGAISSALYGWRRLSCQQQ